ncbi:MAG: hypothetical protein Q8935_01375 [Bacillota bacterium]|nr:hypothetical protein [Bacillota bacterium]
MNTENREKIEQKNITIKIIDNKDVEQHYMISIESEGIELKNVAIIPTFKYLITDNKKEARTKVYLNVPYTIKVYKTNAQELKDYFKHPKKGQKDMKAEKPLVQKTFTPTPDTNILILKVNSN